MMPRRNPITGKQIDTRSGAQRKEYRAAYYQKNKIHLDAASRARNQVWVKANPEKVAASQQKYNLTERRKEKQAAYTKARIARIKETPFYKIRSRLSTRVRLALKGLGKSKTTPEYLGCSIPEFKYHLEGLFTDGMSWDNIGKWHIDHIRPCRTFDLTDIEQQKLCFNFRNLQPLWKIDNLKKSGKWNYPIAI
jgi:hypothetical protein